MNLKRPLATLAVAAGLLCTGATPVTATSDYPPAGAVMVVTGDLVTGGTAQAMVQNCAVGEEVHATLASMPTVKSRCASVVSGFVGIGAAPLPGTSRFDLQLPTEPGVVAGEVELLESGQTLTFFLDVRSPESSVVSIDASSTGMPGWPFLLLAGLIVLLAMILVSRRRVAHASP